MDPQKSPTLLFIDMGVAFVGSPENRQTWLQRETVLILPLVGGLVWRLGC